MFRVKDGGKSRDPSHQMNFFEQAGASLPLQPPHAAGSDTSKEAAASVACGTGTLRTEVLRAIASFERFGMTCDEFEHQTGMRHQTASARINELMKLAAIVDSGLRRQTRSGRRATVWVAAAWAPQDTDSP